ncbi:HlyD family secretion protein [Neochlamydia sp. TUME1]|uniref:HlyD family secretion protein n=1 Tax=Neochlamydia sp. TUME1 TaxID=1478174 RepID=UPI0005802489|nr:HlyD family efflux transporter periplasmic adaptor subunit [Neochlamydia sp. TUME1]
MNQKRKYFIVLALFAFIGLLAANWMVFFKKETKIHYLEDPYLHFIARKNAIFGMGIVIPRSEEVAIRASNERRIDKVFVNEGDKVSLGDPLLQLENKELLHEMAASEAALAKAKTQLERLRALPRSENLTSQQALLHQSKVELDEAERQQRLAQDLLAKQAISPGELNQKNYLVEVERAKYSYLMAQLQQLKAGAWQPDLDAANFEVAYQKALLELSRQKLDDTLIRAPLEATVLKVNIHAGELAQASKAEPLMILGDIEECFVEVSVNEDEISYLRPYQEAIGFFRGENHKPIPLSFVKIKPLMVPKKNLTGSIMERIDTRVVQLIYRFKTPQKCFFVGQVMDVFIPDSRNDTHHE